MPNIAWTYATLAEKLQKWPVLSSALYQAQLPTIIGLGEQRLWRDLNIEEYDQVDTDIAMDTGIREVAKPASLLLLRTVAFLVQTTDETEEVFEDFTYLEKRSYEFCQMYAPRLSVLGVPKYYTELDSGQILVVPTPDDDYQMHYRGIGQMPETLSSATPDDTTWLARAVPDALFAACLMEAEHYIKADDRYADWQQKYYSELLPTARLQLRELIRAGDYGPIKPAAAPAA